jgi:hypothetical protein
MSKFILWDGRAKSGETDEATVLDTADTDEEARKSGLNEWHGYDAIWFEYTEIIVTVDNQAVYKGFELGETIVLGGDQRWDLPPASAWCREYPA